MGGGVGWQRLLCRRRTSLSYQLDDLMKKAEAYLRANDLVQSLHWKGLSSSSVILDGYYLVRNETYVYADVFLGTPSESKSVCCQPLFGTSIGVQRTCPHPGKAHLKVSFSFPSLLLLLVGSLGPSCPIPSDCLLGGILELLYVWKTKCERWRLVECGRPPLYLWRELCDV
jgi:hypothetical protein